jgi:hypothetical protein
MPLILEFVDISINYFAVFKEPQLNQIKEESRINLVKKLTTNFNLRLSDLIFDRVSISDKFVKFSKFINRTFFDVSFGLEQISATLSNPINIEQVEKLFGSLFEIIEEAPIELQRFVIQAQSTSKGDSKAFLQKLTPYTPNKFNNLIAGKGITYHLLFEEFNLKGFVTVSDSIILEKGIFVFVQFEFSPNKYTPNESSQVARDKFNFILKELDLSV